jgi:hypothetical protein
MEKIELQTRKVNFDYCSHYLKDRDMMEDLGIDFELIPEEREFDNYKFSLLIDHLGRFESLCRKYHIQTWEELESKLSKSK